MATKKKRRTLYMHTVDGQPAAMHGGQICFSHKQVRTADMCESLSVIRRQQYLSNEYRRKNLNDLDAMRSYGYIRVVIDSE